MLLSAASIKVSHFSQRGNRMQGVSAMIPPGATLCSLSFIASAFPTVVLWCMAWIRMPERQPAATIAAVPAAWERIWPHWRRIPAGWSTGRPDSSRSQSRRCMIGLPIGHSWRRAPARQMDGMCTCWWGIWDGRESWQQTCRSCGGCASSGGCAVPGHMCSSGGGSYHINN